MLWPTVTGHGNHNCYAKSDGICRSRLKTASSRVLPLSWEQKNGDFMSYKNKELKTECNRRQRLKYRFGITAKEYDALFERQQGLCAICKQPEKQRNNQGRLARLAVDHNHATRKNRELLCSLCNKGLGHFRECILVLESAIAYLKKHATD